MPSPVIEEIRQEVTARKWFHRIDLGNGIITPGIDDSPAKLQFLGFPESFAGLDVLDIGAWDGFFSFEAERRGARRVLATDGFCWTGEAKGGFDLAHRILRSKVEEKRIPVEDISPETVGSFDVVFFLGVLYHAQDPMQYLRNVRSVCRNQVIVETLVDGLDYDRPAMVFYPGSSMNNDPTNYWGPNIAAVEAMLREVGFSRTKVINHYWGNRAAVHGWV